MFNRINYSILLLCAALVYIQVSFVSISKAEESITTRLKLKLMDLMSEDLKVCEGRQVSIDDVESLSVLRRPEEACKLRCTVGESFTSFKYQGASVLCCCTSNNSSN